MSASRCDNVRNGRGNGICADSQGITGPGASMNGRGSQQGTQAQFYHQAGHGCRGKGSHGFMPGHRQFFRSLSPWIKRVQARIRPGIHIGKAFFTQDGTVDKGVARSQ